MSMPNERMREQMTAEEIKHLDYIESTITRMATNQFQIKGWSVTVNTALMTIFANSMGKAGGPNELFLLTAVFPTFLFWVLDAKFLSQERRLRKIYADATAYPKRVRTFAMPLRKHKGGKYSLIACMFSFINVLVYLLCMLGFLLAFLLLR